MSILYPFSSTLIPKASQITNFATAGLGVMGGAVLRPAQPPQSGQPALLTYPQSGAACPTCNLVEIPYDASLPHVHM